MDSSRFDYISPLDYRYVGGSEKTLSKLAPYLSEQARISYQAKVEAALAKVLAKNKVCSDKVAKEIKAAAAQVTAAEVYEEEGKTKHDIRALANSIRKKVSDEAKPYVHFSSTSYDIVDTSSALRYKEATENLMLPTLKEFIAILIEIALREKETIQIGRTHGQHAEPITFGFALTEYVSRLGERILALEKAKNSLCGKFSGAVGAYNASSLLIKDPLKFEKQIMGELGLKTAEYSTQVVSPETLEDLIHILISTFTVLANFADDMRNLQRSEINEIAEAFGKNQVGSSTMPHKRNPINFENVKSLWKQFAPRMQTIYADAISEHQRDLTNSASARFIPEIFAALYVSTSRMNLVCKNLVVDKESMQRNFNQNKQMIVAEPLYIILASHSHPNAHEIVRKLTLESQKTKTPLFELAQADPSLEEYLKKFTKEQLALLQSPERYTGLAVKKTEQICARWKKELKL